MEIPHSPEQRNRIIRKASLVGMVGNGFLAVAKIAIGLGSGSVAVLSDGIDSSTDIITSAISLWAARISQRPPNARFPYGYQRAETVGTKALSFIMFFAGLQLIMGSIESLASGEAAPLPTTAALGVTVLSVISKAALAWYKIRLGKRYHAPILSADGKNMLNDVVTSFLVLIGLGLGLVTGLGILDRIAAILVSLWILKSAWEIFMETNIELMDGNSSTEVYAQIIDAVHRVNGAYNPHRLRARRVGSTWAIVMDVELDPHLTLQEAHDISIAIEESVKNELGSVYDVIIHLEPLGNLEINECFGVSSATEGCQGEQD